ncbi:MAG: TIGR00730 family Rossman fold protein [Verrucomicrobia bacterium]|nr:TIGR00730 family Rossman fold protein [Verrucomicrobiota bacterium]
MKTVCVFCGSNFGTRPAYREAAVRVGSLLAARGVTLVYGGGKVGMMGALADACLAGKGKVIGIIPKSLAAKEIGHPNVTELRVVDSMHERKKAMADEADAFLALPGGFGTWDEFCEAVTWSQLGVHRKACAILNVEGFYDAFLAQADRATKEGFVSEVHRSLVISGVDPAELLDRLEQYRVPQEEKWYNR